MYGIHNNHDHIDEGERVKGDRGWKNGERWEKMRETGDKGKKGEKGERKEKSGRRLPHVLPLIDSGIFFVFLESQMHITPLSFEN